MIGDRCEACGIEWDKTMSEWTSDDRRSLIRGIERIASVLDERLPPLPEADANENLKNEVELLRAGNKRFSQNAFAANNRAEEFRLKAASVTLEHDRLLLSHNKLILRHDKLLDRLNSSIISSKCTCTIDSMCARCAVSAFVDCDRKNE